MYTNFPSDGLSSDSLHPNDKGYGFMAKQWYDGIVAILPKAAGF
jgi:lysophospholipase L1-like esterase